MEKMNKVIVSNSQEANEISSQLITMAAAFEITGNLKAAEILNGLADRVSDTAQLMTSTFATFVHDRVRKSLDSN